MTNEEAIEHAKAIQMFCGEVHCCECPFGKQSEINEGKVICILTDYGDIPYGWELEAK